MKSNPVLKILQLLNIRSLGLLLLATHLAACSGGSQNSAAQGSTKTSTSSATDTVSISGKPLTTVASGQSYSFTPSVTDSLGKALTFSISNAPAWATFDTSTGTLSGTPASTQIGDYADIMISAGDGTATASLVAFSITVTPSSTVTSGQPGSATVTWNSSRDNSNGTVLDNLAGYYIYYGTSVDALTAIVSADSAADNVTIAGLTPGATYYFTVVAFNTQGLQSSPSSVVSLKI